MVTLIEKDGLTREQVNELVDILRRNFLYQEPEIHGELAYNRMIGTHWMRMIELLHVHGGWELPKEEALKIAKAKQDGEQNQDEQGHP